MNYYSTNHESADVTLREALLQGQAPDRGLYLPRAIPTVSRDTLESWRGLDYPEVAFEVLSRFVDGEFPADVQRMLAMDAYRFPVPVERVTGRHHILRLDQGPTASFKDFAARMMARWISVILTETKRELLILTATSGDTGSAVAQAFHKLPNIKVCVLFPRTEVSDRQRRQMTTLAENITTIAIDGKFDDAQAMVKRAFADPELKELPLSSANSINIGRLLPQSVYYVWSWLRATRAGEDAVFCVPSGNFGNMMGGMLAWRMGLPVKKFVIGTNSNDEFPNYLASGDYRKIEPSRDALSNAMNVGHPSNLARLVALYGGWMRETGKVERPPDLAAMRRDLWSVAVSDAETRATLAEAWNTYGLTLEPHGAVGWSAITRWLKAEGHGATLAPGLPDSAPGPVTITLETAHPAKFPDPVREATGVDPALPASLAGLEGKPEHAHPLRAQYEDFKGFLKEHYGKVGAAGGKK